MPGILGDDRVFGHLYVIAPAADDPGLSDTVHQAVTDGPATAGATRLPNDAGLLVRATGRTADPVREQLRAGWSAARQRLVGAGVPDRRK